jgi:hypothetical protein
LSSIPQNLTSSLLIAWVREHLDETLDLFSDDILALSKKGEIPALEIPSTRLGVYLLVSAAKPIYCGVTRSPMATFAKRYDEHQKATNRNTKAPYNHPNWPSHFEMTPLIQLSPYTSSTFVYGVEVVATLLYKTLSVDGGFNPQLKSVDEPTLPKINLGGSMKCTICEGTATDTGKMTKHLWNHTFYRELRFGLTQKEIIEKFMVFNQNYINTNKCIQL